MTITPPSGSSIQVTLPNGTVVPLASAKVQVAGVNLDSGIVRLIYGQAPLTKELDAPMPTTPVPSGLSIPQAIAAAAQAQIEANEGWEPGTSTVTVP